MSFKVKTEAERQAEQVKKTFYIIRETEQITTEEKFKEFPDDVSDLNIVFRRLTNRDIIEINKETYRLGRELAERVERAEGAEKDKLSSELSKTYTEESSSFWRLLTLKTVRGIVSWDILGEDGQPLPPSFEIFSQLGDSLQEQIIKFYIDNYTFTTLSKKKL